MTGCSLLGRNLASLAKSYVLGSCDLADSLVLLSIELLEIDRIRRLPSPHVHELLRTALCNDDILLFIDQIPGVSATQRNPRVASLAIIVWMRMKYAQYLFISANVQIGRKSSTRATASIHEFYVSVFIRDQRSAKFLTFSIRKALSPQTVELSL